MYSSGWVRWKQQQKSGAVEWYLCALYHTREHIFPVDCCCCCCLLFTILYGYIQRKLALSPPFSTFCYHIKHASYLSMPIDPLPFSTVLVACHSRHVNCLSFTRNIVCMRNDSHCYVLVPFDEYHTLTHTQTPYSEWWKGKKVLHIRWLSVNSLSLTKPVAKIYVLNGISFLQFL